MQNFTKKDAIKLYETIKEFNTRIPDDKATSFVSAVTSTDGNKDFKKADSRKKDANPFPFNLTKVTSYNGDALISGAGYVSMVRNMIKKHGGSPDLWETKKSSGMDKDDECPIVYVKDDGSEEYLRVYAKITDRSRITSKYIDSNGNEIDKNDSRLDPFRKAPKKDYAPKWLNDVGIPEENVPAFLKEFNSLVTISPNFKSVKKVKVSDFHFSRD